MTVPQNILAVNFIPTTITIARLIFTTTSNIAGFIAYSVTTRSDTTIKRPISSQMSEGPMWAAGKHFSHRWAKFSSAVPLFLTHKLNLRIRRRTQLHLVILVVDLIDFKNCLLWVHGKSVSGLNWLLVRDSRAELENMGCLYCQNWPVVDLIDFQSCIISVPLGPPQIHGHLIPSPSDSSVNAPVSPAFTTPLCFNMLT